MDAHFSEKKNWDLVEFCKSVGLRRAELSALYDNCLKGPVDLGFARTGAERRHSNFESRIGLE